MAGKPVSIATREFATQSEATEFFKAMLNRYKPGDAVINEDAFELAALLERHPEYNQKVGAGIDRFEVMLSTIHGTQYFKINRVDGSGTDFSYLTCIRGMAPSRKTEVSRAFREVVRMDLFRARDAFYSKHRDVDGLLSCAVTKNKIRSDEGHMDHRPPMTFEVIVATFLAGRGLSCDSVPITTGQDNQVTTLIANDALTEAFRQYHERVAVLDFVEKTVNLSQSSKSRIRLGRVKLGNHRP